MEHQFSSVLQRRLDRARRVLDEHRHALAGIEPVTRLRAAGQQLGQARQLLALTVARRLQMHASRLDSLERQLRGVGPLSVLRRGYTYTTDAAARLLRSASDARAARSLVTHFADGTVESQVPSAGGPAPSRLMPAPRRKRPAVADEAGLFTP